jgi:adenylosuccinate lyase
MIDRYADKEIKEIWSDANKLKLWQEVELAVIEARVESGEITKKDFLQIQKTLKENPIDIGWWLAKEEEIKHDLNAFVEERRRFLLPHLQRYFHELITSYDTEEPAFATILKDSLEIVEEHQAELVEVLTKIAEIYRFTIMNARTHGQEAKLQSFGKRISCWIVDLRLDSEILEKAEDCLDYSKLSGAVGNYGSISPHLEKKALEILDFEPYSGATQIMPREIYAPLAYALCQLVMTLQKIALSIRLGARSGRPIFQEPFSKKQIGSSAMPHKKNTIATEQIEGMSRMAKGYLNMIIENITTWEERAIEQSCVERVAWPDLFHVTIHSLKTMTKVLNDLVVHQDNMLLEIIESRGTYASDEAKELLKEFCVCHDITAEECYRMIQLASFNAFEPRKEAESLRLNQVKSLEESGRMLSEFAQIPAREPVSIKDIIAKGELRLSPQLAATVEDIAKWNAILKEVFEDTENIRRWEQIFTPSYLLRNEAMLYAKILNIE